MARFSGSTPELPEGVDGRRNERGPGGRCLEPASPPQEAFYASRASAGLDDGTRQPSGDPDVVYQPVSGFFRADDVFGVHLRGISGLTEP